MIKIHKKIDDLVNKAYYDITHAIINTDTHFEIEITTLLEYLVYPILLSKYYSEKNMQIVFRGLSDENYYPVPSIMITQQEIKENDLIEGAKRKIKASKKDLELYEIQALMQHFGLPTRHMDFTFDYFVATYFALNNKQKNNSRIIVSGFDYNKQDEMSRLANLYSDIGRSAKKLMYFYDNKLGVVSSYNQKYISEKMSKYNVNKELIFKYYGKPIYFIGKRYTKRQVNQKSILCTTGNLIYLSGSKEIKEYSIKDNVPIDFIVEEKLKPISEEYFKKEMISLIISSKIMDEIADYLEKNNYNKKFLFPEGDEIDDKYFKKIRNSVDKIWENLKK